MKPLLPQVNLSANSNLQSQPPQQEEIKKPENPKIADNSMSDVIMIEKLQPVRGAVQREIIITEEYENELKKRNGKIEITVRTREEELMITATFIETTSTHLLNLIDTTDIKCADTQGRFRFFITLIKEKALLMCANSNILAVYTTGCLHLYNLYGMAITEPFCLPNICFLECNQLFSILALQSTGELFLWDMSIRILILKTNVIQLFPKLVKDHILKVFVDECNNVLLNTSKGKVFRYDFNFGVFKRVKDVDVHTMRVGIDFQHLQPYSEMSRLLFSEEVKNGIELDQRRLYQYEINYLEEKLSTAKALRLPEYWILFRKYIIILMETKNYDKLKKICTELDDLHNERLAGCTLINATEEEKKARKLMGKTVKEIVDTEIDNLIYGNENPNIIAIFSKFKSISSANN